MRAVDFAVSQALPEDMRRESYDLGKNGLAQLMAEVAAKHPDQFPAVAQKLGDLGRRAAWLQGYTTSSSDTRQVIDTKNYYAQMDAELDKLRRDKTLSPAEFDEQRSEIMTRYSDMIGKDTMAAAMSARNNFALAVDSGARGNSSHVQAILSTPGVFQDAKGRTIPLFVRNSFGDGVRPAETLAGTYGARSSVVSTKKATARGGDILKQMTQSTLNYNVTEKDCGAENGLVMDPAGEQITGRTLAKAVGDTPAGTVVDRQLLARLRRTGKPVMLRSAMTCRAGHGLCAKCVGVQADGKFPNIGDSIGVTAAQALGEPIVQGALNVKHNCLYINDFRVLSTAGRVLDFHQLQVGDELIGYDGAERRPTRVTAKVDQGLQEVATYDFALPRGRKAMFSITSTACHEVLTAAGKRAIGDVDHVLLPRSYKVDCGVREPLAFFAGFFMGDGIRLAPGLSQSLRVSCAEPATASELDAYLRPFGLCLKKRKRSHDWAVVNTGRDTSPRDPATGRIVSADKHAGKQLVRRLGWEGCYALDKTAPDEVWSWDDASVAAFVSGFITADGSVYRSASGHYGVAMSSTSRPMLERLQQLLWSRMGVWTTCITRTGKVGEGGCKRKNDQWQFTVTNVNDLAILARATTPMGPKREKMAEVAAELPTPDTGPISARLLRVTPRGTKHCVDISVDAPNELFSLANGAVVKNSGMAKGKKAFSGLDYISQFLSIPEEFKDRAAVSEVSGTVVKVEPAPQGGTYITVDDERHFVLPGFEPLVKPGQQVEAGEALSDGLINPADIVRLRGLGEGRKYYAERLSQMLRDSGQKPDARNVEILSRAALDNYMIDDPDEDSPWLPDDLVRESELLSRYKPPADTAETNVTKASGKYLQTPTLHYTVGTKLTPRMVKSMQDAGVERVAVSSQTPWFHPEMKRLRVAAHDSDDWLASMGTSYLGAQLRNHLERGDETNIAENYHFGPRLAFGADAGAGGFGENIERTGKF
jgi:hypothetical protein